MIHHPASKRLPTSRVLLAALTALVALVPARADAQSAADKKRAQDLQIAGVRLLEHGDNQAALQKFQEAIRIFPSPKILFNMGRAHAALGEDVEAVNDFERFLDEAPYAPKQSRDEAQRIIETLRAKLSYVEIGTDDVGSRITVDGREVGVAPLARPLAIAPGPHEVRVEKAEMIAETRSVSPVAGQKVRVFVKLRPVAEARTTVVAPPPPPPPNKDTATPPPRRNGDDDTTTRPPEPIREPEVAPTAGSGPGRRALKWAAWVAAAAGAGVGTYGFLSNQSGVKDFNSGCGFKGGMVMVVGTTKTLDQCNSLKNHYELGTRLAVGGFIGAGILAAAGFVFWATETSPDEGRTALATCLPDLGAGARTASLTCAMRF
jgi:hypothetical protein